MPQRSQKNLNKNNFYAVFIEYSTQTYLSSVAIFIYIGWLSGRSCKPVKTYPSSKPACRWRINGDKRESDHKKYSKVKWCYPRAKPVK